MQTNNVVGLKALLIVQTLAIVIYTYFTIQADGWNFFSAAMEYLPSMLWKGQFSLDFFCYLTLSMLWVMWRNAFSTSGIILGLIAVTFGILFFAPYLYYLLLEEKGDIRNVLLGKRS